MRLWVDEMWYAGKWHPTVGAAITRQDGRKTMAEWRRRNPVDRFRLAPYRRADKDRK